MSVGQDAIVTSLDRALETFKISPREGQRNRLGFFPNESGSTPKWKPLASVRAYNASEGKFEDAIVNYVVPQKPGEVVEGSAPRQGGGHRMLYSVTYKHSGLISRIPEEYILPSRGKTEDGLKGNDLSAAASLKTGSSKQGNVWLIGDECCVDVGKESVLGRIESINYIKQDVKIRISDKLGSRLIESTIPRLALPEGANPSNRSFDLGTAGNSILPQNEMGLPGPQQVALNGENEKNGKERHEKKKTPPVENEKKRLLKTLREGHRGCSLVGTKKLCEQHSRQLSDGKGAYSASGSEDRKLSFVESSSHPEELPNEGEAEKEDAYSAAELGRSSICSDVKIGDMFAGIGNVGESLPLPKLRELPTFEGFSGDLSKQEEEKRIFSQALMAWYQAGFQTGYAMALADSSHKAPS
eukprot:Nk52_evm49s164 gene=Nk52_evmTU49s164